MEASLHDASESGLIEDVRLRLDHGADVDAPAATAKLLGRGGTPLYLSFSSTAAPPSIGRRTHRKEHRSLLCVPKGAPTSRRYSSVVARMSTV
mmetsp:Transcript_17976/g.56125  ORF Transcript_17976/g.56125 Transcript_17976/m.56125 type:complete len:93 (+) Transcript_17976:118-396(+)